jgi:AraC-like DNA-binding protein
VHHVEQVVELADMDLAQEVLSAAYGTMRIGGGCERLWMRVASQMLGSVRLDLVSGNLGFEINSEPQDKYIFGHLDTGRFRYRSGSEERFFLPGEAFVSGRPDVPYTAALDTPEGMLIVLDQAAIDVVADGVRFNGCAAVSPRASATWRATCVHLRDQVLPTFAEEPLVVANATRLLVATTIATFPTIGLVGPTASDRRDAHPATLRRAITFIEDNAARDITAADIAHAARVSIRAMQLAFRRHLDTTPMAYLRRVRLSCADADLRAANGRVTTIAARWGYARPSVFAAQYRAAYGVSPSQTLRSH